MDKWGFIDLQLMVDYVIGLYELEFVDVSVVTKDGSFAADCLLGIVDFGLERVPGTLDEH